MTDNGFGDVVQERNTNSHISGQNNRGILERNTNCVLNCSFSQLDFVRNVNCTLEGLRNKLKLLRSTNVSIRGDENNLSIEKGTNMKLEGNDNTGDFDTNTNFNISGNGNQGSYIQNSNASIKGDNNRIQATNNINLKVKGSGHDITACGTINHHFHKEDGVRKNLVRVEPSKIGGFKIFGFNVLTPGNSVINGRTNPGRVIINYDTKVNVQDTSYSLGIFNFSMDYNEPRFNAVIKPSDFDESSFKVSSKSSDSIVVEGTKNGEFGRLTFSAPNISESSNGKAITISMADKPVSNI